MNTEEPSGKLNLTPIRDQKTKDGQGKAGPTHHFHSFIGGRGTPSPNKSKDSASQSSHKKEHDDKEETKTNASELKDKSEKTLDEEIKSMEDELSKREEKTYIGKRKRCPLIEGCNSIENYIHLNYIHEGVYGVVFRAKDKFTGEICAIKKIKFHRDKEGFPITSIREIGLLLSLSHPNIVNVKEVVTGSSLDKIYVVMEYVEHELKDLMEVVRQGFTISQIKCLMKQLLQAMEYLHNKNIVHRDLKTSNILYSNKGILKVCDFGLARKYMGNRPYTPVVVTLWYRAPEVLLGDDRYTPAIDMWSVGCIFAELVLREPLFRGQTEMEQLEFIFRTLGNPTNSSWPGWKELKYARNLQPKNYVGNRLPDIFPRTSFAGEAVLSEAGLDLLMQMLTYNPEKRITASKALDHKWFKESPLPQDPEMMPTFPATNEVPRDLRKKRF